MNNTIFDKILSKEIPSTPIYEDEIVYAFNDINPLAPVHVLVIPKKKLEKFNDFIVSNPLDIGNFMVGVAKVASSLDLDNKGYRIVFNNGQDGGQEVEYLHAHILGGKKLSFQKP